jgi:hypothetical protein
MTTLHIAQFEQHEERVNDIKTVDVNKIKELKKDILEKENVISEMK